METSASTSPDDDPIFAGAASRLLVNRVVEMLSESGYRCVNCDVTVVCEAPKISPYKGEIGSNLTALLGAPSNVKATTMEGLGPIGRREGIACWATVLIARD